tara:strand:+ start:456 stop:1067 length:612 start_codon:yes stop_codon:yes gene_type:complete
VTWITDEISANHDNALFAKGAVMTRKLILYGVCLCFVACGGQSEEDINQNQTTQAQTTLDHLVEIMEAQGDHPILDRSETLAGQDVNANGIRDDIDGFLTAMNATAKERKAAVSVAQSLQAIQATHLTKDSAEALSQASAVVDACLVKAYGADAAFVLFKRLEAYTANTKARAYQYNDYNALRDGQVGRLLKDPDCHEVSYGE